MPACAIAPKFYGSYVPEDDTQSGLSPILLLEDCGMPIETSTLCADDRFVSHLGLQMFPEGIILLRTQLHAMFAIFHHAGFLQGSVYPRNILIQPGPLTIPPSKRSLASPSFRIIDFGRAEHNHKFICDAIGVAAWNLYHKWKEDYDDFITMVGAAEAQKEYTITVYDNEVWEREDEKAKGEAKSREVTMVMGLEKAQWTKLRKAESKWTDIVRDEETRVRATLSVMGAGF